jgi:hypothetical protein
MVSQAFLPVHLRLSNALALGFLWGTPSYSALCSEEESAEECLRRFVEFRCDHSS